MKSLPEADDTLLVRTDFSDRTAWQALRTAISTPNKDGFLPYVHIVDDPDHDGLTAEQVLALAPAADRGSLLVLADRTTLTTPEMPLLAVHPLDEEEDDEEDDEGGRERPAFGELRVAAAALWVVENNLSLANMDWEDFLRGADDDGVFRAS